MASSFLLARLRCHWRPGVRGGYVLVHLLLLLLLWLLLLWFGWLCLVILLIVGGLVVARVQREPFT